MIENKTEATRVLAKELCPLSSYIREKERGIDRNEEEGRRHKHITALINGAVSIVHI